MAIIDLDRFKSINDTYGHLAGDQLLAAVGARLARQARLLNGCAARLGGDEFLLALPTTRLDEHTRQIEALLHSLSAPVQAESHRGPVTIRPSATAGIACGPDSDWTRLLSAADHALCEAKLLRRQLLCSTEPHASPRALADESLVDITSNVDRYGSTPITAASQVRSAGKI